MERLVKISLDEYIAIGDAGGWVYACWNMTPALDDDPDNHCDEVWDIEREDALRGEYETFYTKVSDDV